MAYLKIKHGEKVVKAKEISNSLACKEYFLRHAPSQLKLQLRHIEQVTSRLGSSGMESAWKATQLSTQLDLASKVIPLDYSGFTKTQYRLGWEVELTARLDDPNIVNIYDIDLNQGNYF